MGMKRSEIAKEVEVRLAMVNERSRIGDCEVDTIVGRKQKGGIVRWWSDDRAAAQSRDQFRPDSRRRCVWVAIAGER